MDDIPTQRANPRNILQPTHKKLRHVGAKKKIKANIPMPKKLKSRQGDITSDMVLLNASGIETPYCKSTKIIRHD